MSFNISVSPSFWTHVDLQATGEDGRIVTGRVQVKYKRPTRDELRAFMERNKNETPTPELMAPYIDDWKGVQDEKGDMPYTLENLVRLEQNIPGSLVAIGGAYIRGASGAREGN